VSELPHLVPPGAESDLAAFLAAHRADVETALLRHGALLFRGFAVADAAATEEPPASPGGVGGGAPPPTPAEAFEAAARALGDGLVADYPELPRAEGATYRTTPYPARETIRLHNEAAHRVSFPRRQWFLCERPAESGGETPVADGRRLLAALPPSLANALRERGLRYVRGFVPGLDLPWQQLFGTSDRDFVEERCRADGAVLEWRDGTPRISLRRPAVIRHPRTGEEVLFGQVLLHHPAFLPSEARRLLTRRLGEDGLPRDVRWGDGAPLDDATALEIGAAYERVETTFAWEARDVLLVDNILVAHGRRPYTGPRSIRVALGAELRLDAAGAAVS